ncbi:hypothetical protein CF095_08330 [Clostridium botulinum]
MNLYLNKLTVGYCFESKECISFEILPYESPYYDVEDIENEELCYREEFVDSCVSYACEVWNSCNFSDKLVVIYEDKYNESKKRENEFVEKCLDYFEGTIFPFKWIDDDETYYGTRYIWKANKINIEKLFRKIIISDIGDDTELDCAVYIVDKETDNIFFLYDDRGIHVFSNDCTFIEEIMEEFPKDVNKL